MNFPNVSLNLHHMSVWVRYSWLTQTKRNFA